MALYSEAFGNKYNVGVLGLVISKAHLNMEIFRLERLFPALIQLAIFWWSKSWGFLL